MSTTPKVSVIVVAYKMALQLEHTLLTLAPEYQRGIGVEDYEVIVLENSSSENFPAEKVAGLPANFRYVLREETAVSPVFAVNEGLEMARAPVICLMIDGARMVSPGLLGTALQAFAISEMAVVAIPGYHVGREEQHLTAGSQDQLAYEQGLLQSVDWREDGYELFTISTLSSANRHGFLNPIMESNALFASAKNFDRIGRANTDFLLPGGGSINLHIFRSLSMLPGSDYFVLPGEGSFHQYHGGVTTSTYEERDADIEEHRQQLHSYWPDGFHGIRREAILLGKVPNQAQRILEFSAHRNQQRKERLAGLDSDIWPDDTDLGIKHSQSYPHRGGG